MPTRSITPYLVVAGRAQAAIALYTRALGARTEVVTRFGDVDGSCPEARRDLVMHAELRIGDALLMISDGAGNRGPTEGGPVSIALDFADADETRRSFDALAEGGKVIEPLFRPPWADLFGVVQDPFGVCWMFNHDAPK